MEPVADPDLVFYGIKITDWLQGIGSLCAVIGGLWAFLTLFGKDKDKQKQIDSLVSIARQSEQQTQQLIHQVEQQRKSVSLLQEQVEIFRSSLQLNIVSEADRKRNLEIKKKQRAIDIQPNFQRCENDFADTIGQGSILQISLTNMGDKGKLIDIVELAGNGSQIAGYDDFENFIEKDEIFSLNLTPKQIGLAMHQVPTVLKLITEDKDTNRYSQTIWGKGTYFTIGNPVPES